MNDEDCKPMITEDEVAKICGLKLGTVRKWRREKRGPDFVRLGRNVRYRMEDVTSFINRNLTTFSKAATVFGVIGAIIVLEYADACWDILSYGYNIHAL